MTFFMRGKQMFDHCSSDESKRLYRVDKFVVPIHAREEFIGNIRSMHKLLRTLPGFVQDFVLEQSAGPGECDFLTLVEWESSDAFANARAVNMAMRKEMKFNPQEMLARFGIKADRANYLRFGA
jgi:heme-degrading monooxygenase HmoA